MQATLDPRRVNRLEDPVENVAIIAFSTRIPNSCANEAKKLVRTCFARCITLRICLTDVHDGYAGH